MFAQKVCLVISPRNASGSREKKNGVGMALDVATLPLILYRIRYITIEHVLHCENIIHVHIPTLFYYFAIPTPFFHFQCFFLLVIIMIHSHCTIRILAWHRLWFLLPCYLNIRLKMGMG